MNATMRLSARSQLFCLVVIVGVVIVCSADTATVKRSSNLRKAPNTGSAILETLSPGDSVTLTSKRIRSRYYHVRAADGTSGWVLANNVSIESSGPSNGGSGAATGTSSTNNTNTPSSLLDQLVAAKITADPQPLIINGQSVCGPTGDATDSKTQFLDGNKNRTDIPSANAYVTIDWDSLAALPIAKVDQIQGAPIQVEGYLSHRLNVEGAESTNCHLTNPDEVDWHMYLTKQPGQQIAHAVVVEATPRTRPLHSWDKSSLDALVNSNTKVRVSGWLMYDWQHLDVVGQQRATVWEVHPITRIETQGSDGSWKNIEVTQ